MIADARRLETSVGVATLSHAALFGLYFFLKAVAPPEETVKLTQVDFIDLTPKSVAAVAAPSSRLMQRAPKNFKDFLHMALPSFKMPKPAAIPVEEPRDMKNEVARPQLDQRASPSLSLKNAPHSPQKMTLRFHPARSNSAVAGRLSDLSDENRPTKDMMEEVPRGKPISLEAVGRVAVSQTPGIRFNAAHFNHSSMMEDIPSAQIPSADGSVQDAKSASINLALRAAPSAQRAAIPSNDLPLGYEKGISLKEGPAHIGASALPQTLSSSQKSAKRELLKSVKHKGMEISGPLAGRKILEARAPAYPAWARRRGVEAEAVIRFFVSADGHVLDRMVLERTSGYRRLDELCMKTLKKMLFVPLPEGHNETQWGFITFSFKLK